MSKHKKSHVQNKLQASSQGLVAPEVITADRVKQLEQQVLATVTYVNNVLVPEVGYLQGAFNALILELQHYDPELCKNWIKKDTSTPNPEEKKNE